ncbi:hypothetical protein GCM10010273_05900 [Streptomyces lavendulocolor]
MRGGSRKYPAIETAETVTFGAVSPQLQAPSRPHPRYTPRLLTHFIRFYSFRAPVGAERPNETHGRVGRKVAI